MLNKVTLIPDHTDPQSWIAYEGEGAEVWQVFKSHNPTFPKYAHIYHNSVAVENDVTPNDPFTFERLMELEGDFFVVVYPGLVALPYIFAVVVAVAAYVLAPAQKPIPTVAQRNTTQSSPNNELSNRTNIVRINGRIPDIYGTVFSIPDLLCAPYKIFENNREVEYAYMCIGRGAYEIQEDDVKDDATRCNRIQGVSVAVYAPYTSPNQDGAIPQLQIGTPITHKVLNTKRSNSVNGQVLRPPNAASFTAAGNVRFTYPNIIELAAGDWQDFSKLFSEGDALHVTNAVLTGGGGATTIEDQNVALFVGNASGVPINPVSFSFDIYSGLSPNYVAGATIVITDLSSTIGDAGYDQTTDLSGTYEIAGVFTLTIPIYVGGIVGTYSIQKAYVQLVSPSSVNSDWNDLVSIGVGVQINKKFRIELGNPSLSFNLNGTYDVISVTEKQIFLNNPVSVAADWANLSSQIYSPFISPTLSTTASPKWSGPFFIDSADMTTLITNFVAVNGLYKDNGTTQTAADITVQMEVTPVDASLTPTAPPQVFTMTLQGSDTLKETIGKTLFATPVIGGKSLVRASRVTPKDEAFSGQVIDEVRWRDLYSSSPVDRTEFGNVTTVHAVTYATASALVVKDRKLNMKVIRKIPQRVPDTSTFTTALSASVDSADIFCAVALDKYIGGRRLEELDVPQIYDTFDAVETYFGTPVVRQFNYTFDKDNFSYEETANAIADAAFCIAYRRGSKIRLSFEQQTDDSTLIFNHRNKIPNTEVRAVSWGNVGDYDGIEYVYASPTDGAITTLFLPLGYAAVNPDKVESIGIANHLFAYFHAYRLYNKQVWQHEGIEFDATQEANLLVRNDRILVSDGTRSKSQEGEVIGVDVLTLTLSQPVDFTVGVAPFFIWLQHTDGIAESIEITAGAEANKVILSDAPRLALVTDESMIRTVYVIVPGDNAAQIAYLFSERESSNKMVSTVRAIGYDDRYYANDKDFINDLIGEDGLGGEGGYTPGSGTGYLILPGAPVLGTIEAGTNPSTVNLSWTIPTAGSWPIVRYDVYVDGAFVTLTSNVSETSVNNFGPFSDGSHSFKVRAMDNHGNPGPFSNVVNFDFSSIVWSTWTQLTRYVSNEDLGSGLLDYSRFTATYQHAYDVAHSGTPNAVLILVISVQGSPDGGALDLTYGGIDVAIAKYQPDSVMNVGVYAIRLDETLPSSNVIDFLCGPDQPSTAWFTAIVIPDAGEVTAMGSVQDATDGSLEINFSGIASAGDAIVVGGLAGDAPSNTDDFISITSSDTGAIVGVTQLHLMSSATALYQKLNADDPTVTLVSTGSTFMVGPALIIKKRIILEAPGAVRELEIVPLDLGSGFGERSVEWLQPNTIPNDHDACIVVVIGGLGVTAAPTSIKYGGVDLVIHHETRNGNSLAVGMLLMRDEDITNSNLTVYWPELDGVFIPVVGQTFYRVHQDSNSFAIDNTAFSPDGSGLQAVADSAITVNTGYALIAAGFRSFATDPSIDPISSEDGGTIFPSYSYTDQVSFTYTVTLGRKLSSEYTTETLPYNDTVNFDSYPTGQSANYRDIGFAFSLKHTT